MRPFELRVIEDVVRPRASLELERANRVIYLVEGRLTVTADSSSTGLGANEAWHGSAACRLTAREEDARVWRWELGDRSAPATSSGEVKLAREIRLAPAARYLMRCDRVDFPPGGVAYTHTHQGPGIRVLLRGEFRVETGGRTLLVRPGEAWFESGPEPVYAAATHSVETSFVRVMILPGELEGRSSIRYVNAEDHEKPKTQRYTVLVDAPITI